MEKNKIKANNKNPKMKKTVCKLSLRIIKNIIAKSNNVAPSFHNLINIDVYMTLFFCKSIKIICVFK